MTWHYARCATTYFERPEDGRCDECLQPLTEENMEPNPMYAEIDRLKRERDALADALREVCTQYENVRNAEGYPFPSRCVQAANELLAQVHK